ncbi:MAG TPA: thioredoxin domain-containing protein [Phycisphaerales bacterium]|nr:thioredoxin domain-containing protein [Phycisphaerales bacterium]
MTTRHTQPDSPARRAEQTASPDHRHTNHLAGQTSPYLLQHAHNPVDWRPWGREAFEEARRRDVPIFLSIGYSTCYWCHVMERESFESEEIAAIMNERFVCIKVDREERPDVDNLYMTATQVFTGHGGWPMSVFLEPEKLRPFWCGTYFPAEPRPGINMPAFPQVLGGLSGAWQNQRAGVLEQAENLAGAVREHLAGAESPVPVGHRDVERAADRLLRAFDQVNGGFGGAPKFPQTSYADFLLETRQHAAEKATREAIDRALKGTLDAMAIGGLRDHVGGGFHRYAVDATWTVPHFEKMLYDQALLALLYTRAAVAYDDAEYKRVVRETLEYVLREMTDAAGGFHSAQDAEVNRREGQNYLWTPTQLAEVLDPGDAEFAAGVYGLEKGPNFQDPHHPHEPPSNVLRLAARPETVAARMKLSRDEFLMRLAGINRKLYAARAKRDQPDKDDKIIAEWNGLMVAAFAEAALLLHDQRYFAAAERAAAFVLERMTGADGRLLRSWRGGEASSPAVLEDYAAMIAGLLALHRAATVRAAVRGPTPYLESAVRLYERAVRDFRAEDMGYHDTRADQEDLFVRSRTTYDGALPSGSSVMLHDLLDLAQATGEPSYLERAVALLRSLSGAISQDAVASVNSTRGLLRLLRTDRSKRDPGTFAPPDADAGDRPTPGEQPSPVEIYAETDRVRVSRDEPAELTLLVRIAEAYHVTASDPRPEAGVPGLAPFRVHVVGGEGIAAYADYPAGEEHGLAGATFRAYVGRFELRIAIEQTGELLGRPRLAITYQACTATECLLPRTVELDVAIETPG